ncbi:MAG: TetR/AcrR family transcriptional regulator [Bryobacteraceae bacterium]
MTGHENPIVSFVPRDAVNKIASAIAFQLEMIEPGGIAARRTKKSDETRTRILEAALDLFRERGFDATTTRDIARESGVALGATYYHFESKEAIVLAFYELAKEELHEPLEAAVVAATGLGDGFSALLEAKFSYYTPNKKFLGALFPHSADPRDPLSLFSEQNRHIRQADAQFFIRLLDKSGISIPDDLKPHLPLLLWLYQMALLLFWIYDDTKDHARTRLVTEKSLAVVTKAIDMSNLPFARPVRRQVIDLINAVMKRP